MSKQLLYITKQVCLYIWEFCWETVGSFFNYVLWSPVLLVDSFLLLCSFFIMLVMNSLYSLRLFDRVSYIIESIILNRYTALTRRVHVPKHMIPKQFTPSICFMGGGHLWMYAIGVGHYIYENFDTREIKYLASSAGCFAAVPLVCNDDPYAWCKQDWGKCIKHFNSRGVIGCLFDSKQFYYDLWDDYLPREGDIYTYCSGRLFISVTHFPSLKNQVISQFNTRNDLINTIVASMCLPYVFMRDFPVHINEVSTLWWCSVVYYILTTKYYTTILYMRL